MILESYKLREHGDVHEGIVVNDEGKKRTVLFETVSSHPSAHALAMSAFAAFRRDEAADAAEAEVQRRIEEANDEGDAEPATDAVEAQDIAQANAEAEEGGSGDDDVVEEEPEEVEEDDDLWGDLDSDDADEEDAEVVLPTMDDSKNDLIAFAESNAVEINAGDTKADILKKISEHFASD